MYNSYNYDPTRTNTYNFLGLNRRRRTAKGEFESMVNMSSAEYPCASPRGKRGLMAHTADTIQCIAAPDSSNTDTVNGFTGIIGTAFYYNGVKKSGNIVLSTDYTWEILRLGDLYILNGCSSDGASLEYYYNLSRDEFKFAVDQMDDMIVTIGSDSKGTFIRVLHFIYSDMVAEPHLTADMEEYERKYFKNRIYAPTNNFFEDYFASGDEISILGFPSDATSGESGNCKVWSFTLSSGTVTAQAGDFSGNNTVDIDNVQNIDDIDEWAITSAIVKSFTTTSRGVEGVTTRIHTMYVDLFNKDGDKIDWARGDNNTWYFRGITLQKKLRAYNHVTTHHARLWGTTPSGSYIYATRRASSSYNMFVLDSNQTANKLAARLEVGTPGKFTGICEYGNYVLAFKESSITVIYGDNAENYSYEIIDGIGCIDGRSIAVTPQGVIFLSFKGFYMYTGAQSPTLISYKLNTLYNNAVSGYDGSIYYASATRRDGVTELLTYDTRCSLWHIQDDFNAVGMFLFRGDFYIADKHDLYITDSESNYAAVVLSAASENEDDFEWEFTSVKTHDNSLDLKSPNLLSIRAECEDGAYFTVETSMDGKEFEFHKKFSSSGMRIFLCSIRTNMGTSWRYRIKGKGKVVFYEIEAIKTDGGRQHKELEGTTSKPDSYEPEDLFDNGTDIDY